MKFLKTHIKSLSIFLITLSILFAAGQMFYLANRESVTTDEKVHVPAGFSYYQFHNFYLNPEHPPLAKLLVALPVYLSHPNYPDATQVLKTASQFYYDSWQETLGWTVRMLYQSGNNVHQIILEARLVNIILALGLIVFLIFWGFQIGSWPGASIAAILASLQPIILAHGHLANTDIGITLFFTLLTYAWWRYFKEKTWKWFLLSVLFFFLCAITKFTFIIFIPFLLISALILGLKEKKINYLQSLKKIVIFGLLVWFLILVFYGFAIALAPVFSSFTQNVSLSDDTIKFLELFRYIAVPAWYFKGLFMVVGHAASGHSSYLFGQFSRDGWWYYFPATIALKTPIGFLLLFSAGLFSVKKFLKSDFALQIILLTGIVVYLAIAMISRADLGQRHVMPIYPLMIIFVTQLVLVIKNKWIKLGVAILVLGTIVSTTVNFQNQIAYFNEFVGGTKNGYKYLLDSNYDWGQSFISIKNYINRNLSGQNVYVEYQWESYGERQYYGLTAKGLGEFDSTKPGVIIVDPFECISTDWLKSLPVIDRIDNTLFVLKYTPR